MPFQPNAPSDLLVSVRKGRRSRAWLSLAKIVGTAPALLVILVYRNAFSRFTLPACRFMPTCSQYALEATQRFGLLRGGWRALRRLLRCQPLSPGGFDPVR